METIIAALGSSVARAPWGWGLLATCWIGLWRYGSPMAAILVAYAEKVRSEKRDDASDCQKRIDAMDVRLTAAEGQAHAFQMQLVGALAAYRILDVEVAARVPNSVARDQAAAVLRDAFVITPSTPNAVAEAIDKGDVGKAMAS